MKKLTAVLKHVETVCCLCCDVEHCRPSAEVYSWQGRTLPTFWMPCRSWSAESLTPRTTELDTDVARNMEQNLEVASWFIVPSSELTQSNKGSERSHCWVIQFNHLLNYMLINANCICLLVLGLIIGLQSWCTNLHDCHEFPWLMQVGVVVCARGQWHGCSPYVALRRRGLVEHEEYNI